MRIIIAPAKKMKEQDSPACCSTPVFLHRAMVLKETIAALSLKEQKELWLCNEQIALQNHQRFATMDLKRNLTAALVGYDGIQYQSMAADVFEQNQIDYLQKHLRILSGFYGVLRPLDGIVPYRLEMSSRLAVCQCADLYRYWKDDLYREVKDEENIIINLASKEYSLCIEKYLQKNDRMITCIFGQLLNGKVVQKGVYAKMARGMMVRYMAENAVESVETIKEFREDGYRFNSDFSTENTFVFTR